MNDLERAKKALHYNDKECPHCHGTIDCMACWETVVEVASEFAKLRAEREQALKDKERESREEGRRDVIGHLRRSGEDITAELVEYYFRLGQRADGGTGESNG